MRGQLGHVLALTKLGGNIRQRRPELCHRTCIERLIGDLTILRRSHFLQLRAIFQVGKRNQGGIIEGVDTPGFVREGDML